MNETRSEMVRIERHPDSPMVVVAVKNGFRALVLSENDQWAIAVAGPARDTWVPTWYAFARSDDNRNGRITCKEARKHGISSPGPIFPGR